MGGDKFTGADTFTNTWRHTASNKLDVATELLFIARANLEKLSACSVRRPNNQ